MELSHKFGTKCLDFGHSVRRRRREACMLCSSFLDGAIISIAFGGPTWFGAPFTSAQRGRPPLRTKRRPSPQCAAVRRGCNSSKRNVVEEQRRQQHRGSKWLKPAKIMFTWCDFMNCLHIYVIRSVNFERTFWFFQFFQKTKEKFLPQ